MNRISEKILKRILVLFKRTLKDRPGNALKIKYVGQMKMAGQQTQSASLSTGKKEMTGE